MNFLIPLKQELLEREPWFVDQLGFHITMDSYSRMGTSEVELESEALRVRFVRDELSVYAEVTSLAEPRTEPQSWWALFFVLEAIHCKAAKSGRELHDEAMLLRANLPALEQALGPAWPRTKKELERRRVLRLQEAMTPRPTDLKALKAPVRLRPKWRRLIPLIGLGIPIAVMLWAAFR